MDGPAGLAGRCLQQYVAGLAFLAFDRQKYAGAVEKGMSLVDVRAPHGQVPRIDDVLYDQRALARFAAPTVVAGLGDADREFAAMRVHRFDLTGEISNKIAAWNPRRK